MFTSRYFEHNQLFVRDGSGIETPQDLEGKCMSIGCFGMNPSVWLRGVLTHQYDVATERISYVTNRPEYFEDYRLPRRYQVEPIPENESVQALVEAGRIDAVSRGRASAVTRPLFEDPYPEIRQYFDLTEVFPPNTVLVIRKDSLAKYPDLPEALLTAFRQALARYREEVTRGSREADHSGLNLIKLEKESSASLPDYGFAANRKNIRAMIQYCYEQGTIRRLYDPEDLFVLTDS